MEQVKCVYLVPLMNLFDCRLLCCLVCIVSVSLQLTKAYFAFLEVLFSSHITFILNLNTNTFMHIVGSLESGLKGLDTNISSQVCSNVQSDYFWSILSFLWRCLVLSFWMRFPWCLLMIWSFSINFLLLSRVHLDHVCNLLGCSYFHEWLP